MCTRRRCAKVYSLYAWNLADTAITIACLGLSVLFVVQLADYEETFGELIVGLNTDNLIRILTRQLRLILLSSDSQNEYALFLNARAPYELTCSQLVIIRF